MVCPSRKEMKEDTDPKRLQYVHCEAFRESGESTVEREDQKDK
jgi:hypothetical protein